MHDAEYRAMTATPIDEIRWRAAIVYDLTRDEFEWLKGPPREVEGCEYAGYQDGAGQFTEWFFADDGTALLLTDDHELQLNFFADDDNGFTYQQNAYTGVPEQLLRFVRDQPDPRLSLNIADPDNHAHTWVAAGGVFWFDGSQWHVSAGLVEHCREHDINDLFFESGTPWCLNEYWFGSDFTPEALVEHNAERGYYKPDSTLPTRDEDLATFRAAFARHPKPGGEPQPEETGVRDSSA